MEVFGQNSFIYRIIYDRIVLSEVIAMTKTGEVIKVRPGRVQVAFCRPDACAKCGACEGGKKETLLWLKGTAGIGDIAVVDMPDRIFINASVIAYLLPLILFLAGLVGGHLLFPASETAEILCALGGVAIAAAVIALTEKKRKADPQWTPVIVDIIPVKERKEIDGTDTE